MAVTRGQRPTTVPMFSPIRLPYYPTWRAAIYCWVNDPQKRPPMEEVARVLKSHIQATSNVTNNLPPLEPVEPEYAQQSRTSEKMSLSKYSQSSLRNHSVFARAAVGNASGKMDGLGLREKDDELGEMEYGEGDEEEGPYCYCEHDRPGAMISCGGRDCQIGWVRQLSTMPSRPLRTNGCYLSSTWIASLCHQTLMSPGFVCNVNKPPNLRFHLWCRLEIWTTHRGPYVSPKTPRRDNSYLFAPVLKPEAGGITFGLQGYHTVLYEGYGSPFPAG